MASGVKKDKSDPDSGGKIDAQYRGIDTAGESNEEKSSSFFSKNNASIFHNQTLQQKAPEVEDTTYADPPHTKKADAKKLSDVRKKFAPSADKPTTASGEKGQLDLPNVIKAIDPSGKAQVMPQMYQTMMQMSSLLSLGSGMGSGGGGGGQQQPTVPSGISVIVQDSFTGCLAILTKVYGFELVIQLFLNALEGDKIKKLDSRYYNVVTNGISNLIRLALYFGPLDIPVSQYDDTYFGDIVPSPLVDIIEVPDLYKKVYYDLSADPYPGYTQWVSPDDSTIMVYTKKEPDSYHFSNPSEETFSTSERSLAKQYDPYLNPLTKADLTLTVDKINEIMDTESYNVEENSMNNNIGNNSGSGGGGGGNMAGMLGGQLQSLMSMFQSQQLPTSVLNQGGINQALQQFQKDMGLNNQIFQLAQGAIGGGSPLGMLGGLGGASNILGGFGLGGGGISGVLGGSLMGAGGFGGGSSGGGGGAGSGFPTAGYSSYSGGNVSEQGIKDIEQMLYLLGIQ